jgi:hypothetical protein
MWSRFASNGKVPGRIYVASSGLRRPGGLTGRLLEQARKEVVSPTDRSSVHFTSTRSKRPPTSTTKSTSRVRSRQRTDCRSGRRVAPARAAGQHERPPNCSDGWRQSKNSLLGVVVIDAGLLDAFVHRQC